MMYKVKQPFFNQIKVSLFFFFISALYGWSLRWYKIVDLTSFDYKSILQAHSHITFLGWGFLAIISIVGYVFYPKELKKSRYLKILFFIMSLSLFGLLISFPLQGYKLFSILFLSIFLFISYLYLIVVLRLLKSNTNYSSKFIKTGIYYYFLSSIAIWAVPIVISIFDKGTIYHNLISFYLHFLYNGFFVFVLFGLLIKYLENKKINIANRYIHNFFILTNISCIPAYVLFLLWTDVPTITYFIGFVAVTLQLLSLFYLYKIISPFLKSSISAFIRFISVFVIISYFLKIIFQFFSVFPIIIQEIVPLKTYFIIGYIHLFTLGFMSLFLIVLLLLHTKISISKIGVTLLMLGVFLSELFLFSQGTIILLFKYSIPSIDLILVIVSGLMPLGIFLIFVGQLRGVTTAQ